MTSAASLRSELVWAPRVIGELPQGKRICVIGMGGSGIPARILMGWNLRKEITLHQDYGIPEWTKQDDDTLLVLHSYSGNTEETLDAYAAAKNAGRKMLVITKGGSLLEHARKDGVPYIEYPDMGIEPRDAAPMMLRTFLFLLGETELYGALERIAYTLVFDPFIAHALELGKALKDSRVIVHASPRHNGLAYLMKVYLNETAGILAYASPIPEANHHELAGMASAHGKETKENTVALFLEGSDDERILHRMEKTRNAYEAAGISCIRIALSGTLIEETVQGMILASQTARALGDLYGGGDPSEAIKAFKRIP